MVPPLVVLILLAAGGAWLVFLGAVMEAHNQLSAILGNAFSILLGSAMFAAAVAAWLAGMGGTP